MRVRPLVVIPAVGIGFNFDIQSFLILEGSGIKRVSAFFFPVHGSLLLSVNPNGQDAAADLNEGSRSVIFSIGTGSMEDGKLKAGPQSFLILR